jgi:predicted TIM-barrel fold metal-dependent hydrolase
MFPVGLIGRRRRQGGSHLEFADCVDVPVIDGHIHFAHPDLAGDLLGILDRLGMSRANLVAVPDLQDVNQNPALIYFKALHPNRVYISGALDYLDTLGGLQGAPQGLATQIARLREMGFDGLKLVEGKPMVRQMLGLPFDGPAYASMWRVLEELGFPVVFHVADPEEFWDPEDCPDWAMDQGWFYGAGGFPAKETLYAEVDAVLSRHPRLGIIFAHFYFLSADLPRAGAFLDAHPSVCFDLTPGVEMYLNFARSVDATRDFFVKYADRIVYGTDIGASAIVGGPEQGIDLVESAGRARIVRQFLERDGPFSAPEGVGHGLGMDAESFHGIALPSDVLAQVYHANFERMFGARPKPLVCQAALAELDRLATGLDARAGAPVDSPARRVGLRLAELTPGGAAR